MYISRVDTILKKVADELRSVEEGRSFCRIPERKGLRRLIPSSSFHDHSEIFFQISGITRFAFPHEKMDLHPGEILVLPPELPHAESADSRVGGFEQLVVTPAGNYFRCHLADESPGGRPVIRVHHTRKGYQHQALRQMADLLIETARREDPWRQTIQRGLLLSLLAETLRLLMTPGKEAPADKDARIQRVENIVLPCYQDKDLSVKEIAAQLSCSADYLSWLFHQETGRTLNRFLTQTRLERAEDLLRNTDYTVSEIAWNCGFGSAAYFSRVFSRYYGAPPKVWRARHRA